MHMAIQSQKINDNLHPLLKYVKVGNLFQACFDSIARNPDKAHLGDGDIKLSGEFDETSPDMVNRFSGTKDCELSLSEALSLCYIAEYMKEKFHKGKVYEYYIPVQIEKSFHADQSTFEWYFGDGKVRWANTYEYAEFPFQETKALNYTPQTSDRVIEDEIIRVINKKTTASKRSGYNDVCGLLISVLPKVSSINYRRVLDAVDISSYDATYLVEYSNDFRTGTVIDLLSHKEVTPSRPLTITPRLVPV